MTNANVDRSSDLFSAQEAATKHRKSRKHRHRVRPCGGNTPEVPTGLAFEWDTFEKARHRRLEAILDWTPVTTNTSGAGAKMKRYRVQLQRSLDGGATIVGRTRKWTVPESTFVDVSAASIVSGTVAEFTLADRHDLTAGDTVVVTGMTPAGYNGTWTVLGTGLGPKVFRANIGTAPGAATDFGEAREDVTSVEVRAIRKHVWYRFRVQAENANGCRGDWSDFTNWTLANDHTAPPTPLNVRIYAASTNRIVMDWDPPTVFLPIEGTVSGTIGTATLTGTGTFFNTQVAIGDVIRLGTAGDQRTVLAIASDTSLTVDSNLSATVTDVIAYTEEVDHDVAGYDVWISKDDDTFAPPAYRRDVDHHTTRIGIRVDDADFGSVFYGRVKTHDASRNRSAWIPATYAGNSTPGTTPEGAAIGAGGGGFVVATFRKIGRVRVKHYANARWTNTTGGTLTFHRARATVGDKDAGTGAPTGTHGITINLRRWLADESAHAPVFDNGAGGDDDTRLYIDPGTYKDVNGPTTFSITSLAADQAISVKVTNVGTTFPGRDLVVQVFMEP